MTTLTINGDVIAIDTVWDTSTGTAEIGEGQRSWIVAVDRETAGALAREHWEDMAKHDRSEFACIIGEERLVQWALGESDSYGISSLEEFLEITADNPEDELAGYDGAEQDASAACPVLLKELGFSPTVAYRTK